MNREKPGIDLWMRAHTQRLNVNAPIDRTPVTDNPDLTPARGQLVFAETPNTTEIGRGYGGRPTRHGRVSYLGAVLGYGSSNRDIVHGNITATNPGAAIPRDNINGDTTSAHGGLYATFITTDGWYVDVVGKLNHFKNKFFALSEDDVPMSADYATTAFGASVELGKRVALGGNWHLTPSAQLALARIQAAEYDTRTPIAEYNNTVTQGLTTSRQVRAGLLLGHTIATKTAQVIRPYARLHVAHQWTDGGVVTVRRADNALSDDYLYRGTIRGARVEAGLGVNWQVLRTFQVYLDYDCAWAKSYKKPYGFTLGANYAW
jgi:outer membrane autotransporter protein